MARREVVITGIGLVTPIGIGVSNYWRACLAGQNGVDLLQSFDTSAYKVKIAAECLDFEAKDYFSVKEIRRLTRATKFAIVSADLALKDAGLNVNETPALRSGVIVGSGFGSVMFHEEQLLNCLRKGPSAVHPLSTPLINPNALAAEIAIKYQLKGCNLTIGTGCSSGTVAIGEALRKIQYGEMDVVLAGGSESPLSEGCFAAFAALRCMSTRNECPEQASRPFDALRDGFVLGEAAAILVLEEKQHALSRKAKIYAEVSGYANFSGAYHIASPEPTGEGFCRVMQGAIDDGAVEVGQIDYINAHGSGNKISDISETKAIKQLFGARAEKIAISSTKSMIGHTVGASGAIEAATCALALREQIVPPTINLTNPDPECDLDYVSEGARNTPLDKALSNSFGFGSNNSCLLLSKV